MIVQQLYLNQRRLALEEYKVNPITGTINLLVDASPDDMLYIKDVVPGQPTIQVFIHLEANTWRCFCDNCVHSIDEVLAVVNKYAERYMIRLCATHGFEFELFDTARIQELHAQGLAQIAKAIGPSDAPAPDALTPPQAFPIFGGDPYSKSSQN